MSERYRVHGYTEREGEREGGREGGRDVHKVSPLSCAVIRVSFGGGGQGAFDPLGNVVNIFYIQRA